VTAAQPGTIHPLTARRRIIVAIAAAAAGSAPGVLRVGRGGPRPLAWLAGDPVETRLVDGLVHVRLWLIVTAGRPFADVSARVRVAVRAAIEGQLGLALGDVTVFIDGVGG
jgi:uncharacterized alkaline shock family protein YloU